MILNNDISIYCIKNIVKEKIFYRGSPLLLLLTFIFLFIFYIYSSLVNILSIVE